MLQGQGHCRVKIQNFNKYSSRYNLVNLLTFVAKVGMVMYLRELECSAERLVCYPGDEGSIKGMYYTSITSTNTCEHDPFF